MSGIGIDVPWTDLVMGYLKYKWIKENCKYDGGRVWIRIDGYDALPEYLDPMMDRILKEENIVK